MKITIEDLISRCDCNSTIKIFASKNERTSILEEDAMRCWDAFKGDSTEIPKSKYADIIWRLKNVEIADFNISAGYSDHFPTVKIFIGGIENA